MKLPFILYTHPFSANGRKVLLVSQFLQLHPEIKLINVYKGEGQVPDYLKIHPLGQIPALSNLADCLTILDSNAIMIYIADVFGNGQLYPKDPKQRAEIHQWLFWEASQWQPALSSVLKGVVGHQLVPHIVPAPVDEPNWDDPILLRQLAYLDTHLHQRPYLVGNELTIADLSVAGMMTYFRFAGFPFKNYPSISQWFNKIEMLPVWEKTADPLWDHSNVKATVTISRL